MKAMLFLSDVMIPLLIFTIVGYGLLNKQNIYEEFIEGAKDGFHTVIGIMPTLIGLMVAVESSGRPVFWNFLRDCAAG